LLPLYPKTGRVEEKPIKKHMAYWTVEVHLGFILIMYETSTIQWPNSCPKKELLNDPWKGWPMTSVLLLVSLTNTRNKLHHTEKKIGRNSGRI